MKREERLKIHSIGASPLAQRMGVLFLILTLLTVPLLNEIPALHSHDETVTCDGSHEHDTQTHHEEHSETIEQLDESLFEECLFLTWNNNNSSGVDFVEPFQLFSLTVPSQFNTYSEFFSTQSITNALSRAPPFIV